MSLWSIVQIGLAAIAFILAFLGDKFSIPALLYSGISLFGVAAIVVGLQAMITRQIVFHRQRNYSETFLGLAVYAQGVQFSLIGIFFIFTSLAAYLDQGRDIFLYLITRPWPVLTVFGVYCLMQAIIVIAGSIEQSQSARWIMMLDLVVGRILPGGILIVIGLGACGLGLVEFVAPAYFDALGGGFLEVLFGV
jgi:hypothetical protein